MKIGIVVFAYNRPNHLSKVLEGLKKNENIRNIYIFQDGLKRKEHQEGWEQTKRVIREIDWCRVEYRLSTINKGIAQSIMEGISEVFKREDALIILEDDCVPASNFVSFMRRCLEQYENNYNIYSVTGYGYPVQLNKDCSDIYFIGRGSSWGWGTWKDRWENFWPDDDVLNRIRQDKRKSVYLAMWGNDLETMLNDRLLGKNDSWAVYWALHIIDRMGLNVVPYQSYIQNIGMDGTGVHCGTTNQYDVAIRHEEKTDFFLPQKTIMYSKASELFLKWFGGYTVNNLDLRKEHILIYGLGTYFRHIEKYICENYYIEAFIDQTKSGYYAGKRIIRPSGIINYADCKIGITIQDKCECQRVAYELEIKYNILSQNIGTISEKGWKKLVTLN